MGRLGNQSTLADWQSPMRKPLIKLLRKSYTQQNIPEEPYSIHFIQHAAEKVTVKHKDVIESTTDKQMKESVLILKTVSLHQGKEGRGLSMWEKLIN